MAVRVFDVEIEVNQARRSRLAMRMLGAANGVGFKRCFRLEFRGLAPRTNVVSELRKPKPDITVAEFVNTQPGEILFTTEVTFGEIRFGIEQLEDASRRADIHLWVDSLRPLFANRVLDITEDVIVRWKAMVVEGQRRGHTFGQPDLFIAAIAALEDLVVVTRDTGEFVAGGVPAFDPWPKYLACPRKTDAYYCTGLGGSCSRSDSRHETWQMKQCLSAVTHETNRVG